MKKIIKKTKKQNNIGFLNEFEKRIDVILFRSKFCISIRNSRQLISHGKILVNGKITKNKSYRLKAGDTLSVNPKIYMAIEKNIAYHFILNGTIWPIPPSYLTINYKTMEVIFNPIDDNVSNTADFNLNAEKLTQNYKYH